MNISSSVVSRSRSTRVSPDGRLIAYMSNQSGQWSLRVAPLTESDVSRSIEIAQMPPGRNRVTRWTADGQLTTSAAIDTDNIYGLRLDDSRPNRRLERGSFTRRRVRASRESRRMTGGSCSMDWAVSM